MTVPNPRQLFDLSCTLLQTAQACLEANDVTVPDSVYLTPCAPDLICCSTLAVRQTTIDPLEQTDSSNCVYRRDVTFEVWLTRCVQPFTQNNRLPALGDCSTDPVPEVGTVAAQALMIDVDRWVIVMCLLQSLRALDRDLGWCCAPLRWGQIEPICEGGCAGTRFEVILTI